MDTEHTLTAAYLEPWTGNAVDLTLVDGTHRIGLLEKVDAQWAQLNPGRGKTALPDGGMVRIARTTAIVRAPRATN